MASYPETFEVEIDRDRLRAYLRARWLISWFCTLGFFCLMFGAMGVSGMIERHPRMPGRDTALFVASVLGLSTLLAVALSLAAYFLLSHARAARHAATLRLDVEGSYLRIRQVAGGLRDRKLHFRSLVDYTTVEGPLMHRFGIAILQITTTAGGPASIINIPGVRDCLRVRDMLAEIDAQREA